MDTTRPTRPPRAPSALDGGTSEPRGDHIAASELPTFGEMVDEVVPVIDVIAVAGPPVIFVAAPWLLLGLMLSGPFALLVAMFVVAIALVALVALAAAMLAAPYFLVRYARERRARHAVAHEPVAPLVSVGSGRVVA